MLTIKLANTSNRVFQAVLQLAHISRFARCPVAIMDGPLSTFPHRDTVANTPRPPMLSSTLGKPYTSDLLQTPLLTMIQAALHNFLVVTRRFPSPFILPSPKVTTEETMFTTTCLTHVKFRITSMTATVDTRMSTHPCRRRLL